MKSKTFIKSLLIITLSFCFIGEIEAACSSPSDYYSGKSSGCRASTKKTGLSNNANQLKNYTCEYNFKFGISGNKAVSYTKDSAHSLSDTNIKKWLNFKPDYHLNQPAFGATDSSSSTTNYSYYYKNVGTYYDKEKCKGYKIDVKETLTGYNLGNKIHLNNCGTSKNKCYKNFIDFYNNKNNYSDYIGVMTIGGKWIRVKYEFFDNETKKPIIVKGYTTYWDVDWDQGILLAGGEPDNKPRIFSNNSKLKKADYNGNPYIFDNDCKDSDNENKYYAFTELFKGQSITRVFTFQKTNKCDCKLTAAGEIWQDPKPIAAADCNEVCNTIVTEESPTTAKKTKATDTPTNCTSKGQFTTKDNVEKSGGNPARLSHEQIMACSLTNGSCNKTNTKITRSGNIQTTTNTKYTYKVQGFENEGTSSCPAYCTWEYEFKDLFREQSNTTTNKKINVYRTTLQIPEGEDDYALGRATITRKCVSKCNKIPIIPDLTAEVNYEKGYPSELKQLTKKGYEITKNSIQSKNITETKYNKALDYYYYIEQIYTTKFTNGGETYCMTSNNNILTCGSIKDQDKIKELTGIYKTNSENKMENNKAYKIDATYNINNRDEFNHVHKCTYKIDKTENYHCYGELCIPNFKYRQISLDKIFNNDKIPLNWLSVFTNAKEAIQDKGEKIFVGDGDYSFKITASQINEIKEYNKSHNYTKDDNQSFWNELTTTTKYCEYKGKKE